MPLPMMRSSETFHSESKTQHEYVIFRVNFENDHEKFIRIVLGDHIVNGVDMRPSMAQLLKN